MIGAALTYAAINLGEGELQGWAIPIATDNAFAIGVLGPAGRRAPAELRAFMLTLAIVDDLGTILVIAVFYSSGLEAAWLVAGAGGLAAIVAPQRLNVRLLVPYSLLAALTWVAALKAVCIPRSPEWPSASSPRRSPFFRVTVRARRSESS